MNGNVIVIEPSGVFRQVPLERDERGSCLTCLQKHVCGLIERIDPRFADMNGLDLWINEDGKLRGMEHNPIATALSSVYGHDALVGPCLIARTDENGDTLPLTPYDVERLTFRIGSLGGRLGAEGSAA